VSGRFEAEESSYNLVETIIDDDTGIAIKKLGKLIMQETSSGVLELFKI
jgi:hypothetical protein